jgi:demethylmenaquinone methyltransferase/2-methoxy-6-polyprenyl-1,4-benzoquinol methylase
MFSSIAARYDFLNRLLSFSFDRVWRRRAAQHFRHILARADACMLDICCGTGDLTLALGKIAAKEARKSRRTMHGALLFGSDFAHPMLVRAVEKAKRASSRAGYLEADALKLPFPDSSFDLITVAFGFRNLANYERGLREMHRLLRPGGELGILDFSEPQNRLFAPLYRFYLEKILPCIGGLISGCPAAYSYLPSSLTRFPLPEELTALIARLGFVGAQVQFWTGGIVALYTARRG